MFLKLINPNYKQLHILFLGLDLIWTEERTPIKDNLTHDFWISKSLEKGVIIRNKSHRL